MEKCRAKFKLSAVVTYEHEYGGYQELVFDTYYDDTIPEDQRFQKATPNGTIKMRIDNPSALEFFGKAGKFFYADFVKVAE